MELLVQNLSQPQLWLSDLGLVTLSLLADLLHRAVRKIKRGGEMPGALSELLGGDEGNK